jgi:hypothetical protein
VSSPILTLTTDFGDRDTYVAQMKGAALAVHPDATLVDLCHAVPAHDIAAGAYLLESGYAAFPPGTIHVAVVDPGVGSSRRALVVETDRYTFIAPDNGLLSRVLQHEPPMRAYQLTETRFWRMPTRTTFDGRDVLAPVAAWIARGVRLADLGPAVVPSFAPSPGMSWAASGDSVLALHIDHFGNVILDVTRTSLEAVLGRPLVASDTCVLTTAQGTIRGPYPNYAEAPAAGPFSLFNSNGYLEIALREGRAVDQLELRSGDRLRLSLGVDSQGQRPHGIVGT